MPVWFPRACVSGLKFLRWILSRLNGKPVRQEELPCRIESKPEMLVCETGRCRQFLPSRFEQVEKNSGCCPSAGPQPESVILTDYLPSCKEVSTISSFFGDSLIAIMALWKRWKMAGNNIRAKDFYMGEVFCEAQLGFNMMFEEEIRPEYFRHPCQKSIYVYFRPAPFDFIKLHEFSQVGSQIGYLFAHLRQSFYAACPEARTIFRFHQHCS